MPADPWLVDRMHDYVTISRAEAQLRPAVRAATETFLLQVRHDLLGTPAPAASFATTTDDGDDEPDLNAFPPEAAWRRLITDRIRPVIRSLFDAAYLRVAALRDPRAAAAADQHTRSLPERLAAFPRAVYRRLADALRTGRQRGETPAQLRDRVRQLTTMEDWDGHASTMTRTEVMTALNAGAFQGALDEQSRTGATWTKRWQATHDARVRHTHADADGQLRDLFDPFTVGGAPLQFPGDPRGPASEVINCRCSCRYAPTGDPSLTAEPRRRTP